MNSGSVPVWMSVLGAWGFFPWCSLAIPPGTCVSHHTSPPPMLPLGHRGSLGEEILFSSSLLFWAWE